MKQSVSVLALIALAACSEKEAEETSAAVAQRPTAPVASGSKPAAAPGEEAGRKAKAEAYFASLAGVWAVEGGCGDPEREWRLAPRAFHAGDVHCDVLFLEAAAQGGARAVAECLVDGYSDGAEDSFVFAPQSEGRLVILDETIGVENSGLVKCREAQL
ncbi:MAG: hypothetical protein VX640_05895 [Pseudomonadota bacterium]|nr:hypothetical protein [Pseudomonadota bacterium]